MRYSSQGRWQRREADAKQSWKNTCTRYAKQEGRMSKWQVRQHGDDKKVDLLAFSRCSCEGECQRHVPAEPQFGGGRSNTIVVAAPAKNFVSNQRRPSKCQKLRNSPAGQQHCLNWTPLIGVASDFRCALQELSGCATCKLYSTIQA